MKANYYMGQTIGKTRKDGSPFYVINILAVNRFGSLDVNPLFVSEQEYNEILNMKFLPGDPVLVSVTFTGVFSGIELDKRYEPLNLDEPKHVK